jgi:hypothetical protein
VTEPEGKKLYTCKANTNFNQKLLRNKKISKFATIKNSPETTIFQNLLQSKIPQKQQYFKICYNQKFPRNNKISKFATIKNSSGTTKF